MTFNSKQYHLPKECADRFPQLWPLASEGLPSIIRWRYHSTGPEFHFDFGLLARGGIPYEEATIASSQHYISDIADHLPIGSYFYTFLNFQQQSDVCARRSDGSLWIIDLKRDSIITRFESSELVAERIPVFRQYINRGGIEFMNCIKTFLELVERYYGVERDEAQAKSDWMQFGEHVRQIDPTIVNDDASFWRCILGERLGPF